MRLEDVVSALPDYDALRVYSDWLEDQDDLVGAMAVRWLVNNGKWPEPVFCVDNKSPSFWVFGTDRCAMSRRVRFNFRIPTVFMRGVDDWYEFFPHGITGVALGPLEAIQEFIARYKQLHESGKLPPECWPEEVFAHDR